MADSQPTSQPQQPGLAQCLLDEHYDRVYRYAYHLSGAQHSAEDIAQEVFLRAVKSAHQLRQPEAAVGWLLAITRNEFARWCRGQSAVVQEPIEREAPASDSVGVLEDYEWIHLAMQQLSVEFRTVVLMFYFEHKSYTEIATELSLPIGTVMSRLSRGRSHLKQALLTLAEPKTTPSVMRTDEPKDAGERPLVMSTEP
ncbi:MAG: RNA polymerase sigma factor [Pirellulaceae bacterium]|nr:RNA polymerase sigma factor [Pirellulaceae bacterium]